MLAETMVNRIDVLGSSSIMEGWSCDGMLLEELMKASVPQLVRSSLDLKRSVLYRCQPRLHSRAGDIDSAQNT